MISGVKFLCGKNLSKAVRCGDMSHKDLTKPVSEYVVKVHTVIYADQTIEEALSELRKRHISDKIIYFYVIDPEGKLVGFIPTRTLLLAEPEARIGNIMQSAVISLKGSQTLREAMEFLESHRLLALPVIDDEGKFLGVIDVDLYLEESVDVARANRRSDVFQMIGLYVEEGKKFTPWKSYRSRMPWISCNIFGGMACAVIARVFELVLAKVLLLAMFIPLLLTLSESISMQSMAQSMQLLRRNKLSLKHAIQALLREGKVIGLLSVTCGLAVGAVSLLWGEGFTPALTISTGILVSVLISASVGSAVPLIIHSRNWDPKVAAGPVVLMFADVMTTTIYLSLATWWLM